MRLMMTGARALLAALVAPLGVAPWPLTLPTAAAVSTGASTADDGAAGSVAAGLPACATCADFCAGKCSFPGPGAAVLQRPLGVPQNLTVTRYTPADVAGLTDKDSGDASGDL